MKRIGLFVLGLFLLLNGCSDTKKIAPKEGRISLISEDTLLQSSEKIYLDKNSQISQWTAPNTNMRNKLPAVSLEKAVSAWKAKGGEGRQGSALPMVPPVVINTIIYSLDAKSILVSRNVEDGAENWRADLGTAAHGIGLTADKNFVIASDEMGTIAVFNTKGEQLWKKTLESNFRNAPLLVDNTLYLLSVDNSLWALNVKTGSEKWHYKTSSPLTLLQGMGRPAFEEGILVVPFSTGEVVAFEAASGNLLWSQDLIGEKAFDAIAGLAQITASPVIENGVVYLVGHAGKTMAVNLKTGESIWQLNQGGKTTPLISGNAFFFVDNNNQLSALNKKSGKLFWQTKLEKMLWKGPYLIDNKLVLFSDEKSVFVNPKDGKTTYQENKMKGSLPAITNKGVFFLGDNGVLYHWGKF